MKKPFVTSILLIMSAIAAAAPDISQKGKWKAEGNLPRDQVEFGILDRVVAETATHFVVTSDAGTSCAAGNQWLFNKKTNKYKAVDSGTCDDRNFKVILDSKKLIFKNGNKITAQYPVYDF